MDLEGENGLREEKGSAVTAFVAEIVTKSEGVSLPGAGLPLGMGRAASQGPFPAPLALLSAGLGQALLGDLKNGNSVLGVETVRVQSGTTSQRHCQPETRRNLVFLNTNCCCISFHFKNSSCYESCCASLGGKKKLQV